MTFRSTGRTERFRTRSPALHDSGCLLTAFSAAPIGSAPRPAVLRSEKGKGKGKGKGKVKTKAKDPIEIAMLTFHPTRLVKTRDRKRQEQGQRENPKVGSCLHPSLSPDCSSFTPLVPSVLEGQRHCGAPFSWNTFRSLHPFVI